MIINKLVQNQFIIIIFIAKTCLNSMQRDQLFIMFNRIQLINNILN